MQVFSAIVVAAPEKKLPKATLAFGLAMVLLGFLLRFWSTGYAGIATRTHKQVRPERLITAGPFRYSRNPIYAGNQLMFAGALLCLGQGVRALVFSIPAFLFYCLITRYEEDLLGREFGEEYEEYRKKTPRWIPDTSGRSIQSCDSGRLSDRNGAGEFSWLRALQTERFTIYNCASLFLLRRTFRSSKRSYWQ